MLCKQRVHLQSGATSRQSPWQSCIIRTKILIPSLSLQGSRSKQLHQVVHIQPKAKESTQRLGFPNILETREKQGQGRAMSRGSLVTAKQAFVAAWLASGLTCYKFLSSDTLELPEVPSWLWQLGCGTAAVAVATPVLLKLLFRDRFHVELHRGKLYFQLVGVPPNGPPTPDDSVEVRPTGDVRGNGAYAVKPISKGQHVCNYEGELLDVDQYWERYPNGASDYVMRIDDEFALDASQLVPHTARFSAVHMNHSRRPNVGRFYTRRENCVAFYVLRDIAAGEEITIDYGRDFWMGREDMELL